MKKSILISFFLTSLFISSSCSSQKSYNGLYYSTNTGSDISLYISDTLFMMVAHGGFDYGVEGVILDTTHVVTVGKINRDPKFKYVLNANTSWELFGNIGFLTTERVDTALNGNSKIDIKVPGLPSDSYCTSIRIWDSVANDLDVTSTLKADSSLVVPLNGKDMTVYLDGAIIPNSIYSPFGGIMSINFRMAGFGFIDKTIIRPNTAITLTFPEMTANSIKRFFFKDEKFLWDPKYGSIEWHSAGFEKINDKDLEDKMREKFNKESEKYTFLYDSFD